MVQGFGFSMKIRGFTSSARGTITVEEVMEWAMCRYIDFPGVGVIDLEAPQLLEKVLEVVT
jgi:hypothetical protein